MASIATKREKAADTLVVFLPGRKDRAGVFVKEGFFDVVRKRGLAADVIAADAHAGYYARGTLLDRLDRDVIPAATRRRYRRLILVGVSLGGYGALLYARTHPREVSAVVVLSPFLGAGSVMREFSDAADPDFAMTWKWLQSSSDRPRILLGYGQEDMLLVTDTRLRELLPGQDVVTQPGFHDWSTWRALFDKLVASDALAP